MLCSLLLNSSFVTFLIIIRQPTHFSNSLLLLIYPFASLCLVQQQHNHLASSHFSATLFSWFFLINGSLYLFRFCHLSSLFVSLSLPFCLYVCVFLFWHIYCFYCCCFFILLFSLRPSRNSFT